jgi:hypothetical protein
MKRTPEEIEEQLARLEATVERQQQLLEDQRERLAELSAEPAIILKDGRSRSRREVMKLAGAGVLGAAGAIALRAVPAAAANGDPLLIGSTANSGTSATELFVTPVAGVNTSEFFVDSSANGGIWALNTSATNSTFGVRGTTPNGASPGVWGENSGGGNGVLGDGGTGGAAIGVFGTTGTVGVGVWGVTGGGGTGVVGQSTSGPDFWAFGTGRIVQNPNSTGSAAPNFTTGLFELVRGGDNALWASRGTGAATAGWKRVNALRVDAADGSGAVFKPLRLVDTRNGTGGITGPLNNGTTTTWTAAGAGIGASAIPSDAIAVVGNLSATAFSNNGFLALHPAGTAFNPAADPSSLNMSNGQGAIANSFVIGLGQGVTNGGKLSVYVGVQGAGSTHVIIDITGYIQ